jgi:UPF0271 protein
MALAQTCFAAARDIAPEIIMLVLVNTPMQTAAEALGCNWVGEVFADRAYNDDCSLVDRRLPGAVIHDPAVAAQRMRDMVREGAIITIGGQRIAANFGTICVHGDTAEAIDIAKAVRQGLEGDGVVVRGLR